MDADPRTVPLDRLDRLWDFDDPALSERRFLALLPRARAERDGALLAEALTQLARARGLQGRFDDADSTLEEAEASLRRDDERSRVRLLLERGRVANSARREGRGKSQFAEAWERARAAGEDGLAVDAAHMLGVVEPGAEGVRWNERAMELAVTSGDPSARRWVASLANNTGWARHEAGAHDEALALFELALAERERRGSPTQVRIARWCVARCLRSLGRVDEALTRQRALAAELEAAGAVDGYVDEEIGECLLALDRGDAARPFFARAHDELSKDPGLQADDPERLERLRSLGGP